MSKYLIIDETKRYYFANVYGLLVTTRYEITIFPNKKKAKRILKRLNKHHGGDWELKESKP